MTVKFLIFSAVFLFFFATCSFGQIVHDTLFIDFDLLTRKPTNPVQRIDSKSFKKYLKYPEGKTKNNNKLEFVEYFKDTLWGKRKATVYRSGDGTTIAFNVMKTAGYEKVIIFGDKDYYYDTLLIIKDTFVFKEISDNGIDLAILYPPKGDTLIMRYGHRNIRYDFLDKFSFRPISKYYNSWMNEPALDFVDTYTLVRREDSYELIKMETTRESISEYDARRLKEQFVEAGLSRFWIALIKLAL